MGRTRLLAAVVAAVAVLAVPSAAQAADGPEINYVNSEFEGDTGVLLVAVSAPEGVASVHADVKNNAGEKIAESDDFWLYRGTHEEGVWATVEPFHLADLGYYPVDVTVTDRAGVTAGRAGAGTLSYVVATFFDDLKIKPASTTWEKRDITVTGTLKGTWPGGGEVRRVPAVSLEVSAYMEWANVETAADGTFTGTLPIDTDDTLVSVNFQNWDGPRIYLSTYADAGRVKIKPRPTRVTATPSAKKVKAGEPVTISGTASWKTPTGWEPVTTGHVAVQNCAENCFPEVDAEGRYSVTLTPYGSDTLTATYVAPQRPDGYPDPYVAVSHKDVEVFVLQESEITDFTAARDEAGKVAVYGQVRFPGPMTPGDIPVEFQYSATGTGDWLTVGDDRQAYWSGSGGYEFEGSVTEPRAGYWRAHYPGDPHNFQSATSRKIKVS